MRTHSKLPRTRRSTLGAAVALASGAGLGLLGPDTLPAQERLVRFTTASAGVVYENVRFGRGIAQGGAGEESVVASASQIVVPLYLSVPVGSRWTVDVASYAATSDVRFDDGDGGTLTARMSGLGDLRLRAAGSFRDDGVLLTFGLTLPSGSQRLEGEELAALGVLAAPALGINLPAVSLGPNQTAGVVFTRAVGERALALGMSYERRARFAPVAALAAGLAPTRYDPGDVLHLSLGTDGALGRHALSVSLLADVYAQDRLVGADDAAASRIKLGPTLGADVQLKLASSRVRDLTLFLSDRVRGSFSRAGASVAGSGANYLALGAMGAVPLRPGTALTTAIQAWRHSGLTADDALVTAETLGGAVTVGVDHRAGRLSWQPFLRLRRGSLDTGIERGSATGASLGLNVARRF
ncbi:MAG: hypothetical protein ACXWZS_09740 [Gemmatirosa sp.]